MPKVDFGGVDVKGKRIATPAVVVVDCRDGLILGETTYLGSTPLLDQAANGVAE